jgi:hypothetical protein
MVWIPEGSPISKLWDNTYILTAGQSVGAGSEISLSLSQPGRNLKLRDSFEDVAPSAGGGITSLIPLTAPMRSPAFYGNYSAMYPNNITGETPEIAMANQLAVLRNWKIIAGNVAEAGHGIDYISLGGSAIADSVGEYGNAYAKTLWEVTEVKKLTDALHESFGVLAVLFVHGEADVQSSTYEAKVLKLWNDYNAAIKLITGQQRDIIMILSVQASCPPTTGVRPKSTEACYNLAKLYPAKFIALPKYHFIYRDETPYYYGLHLTPPSERRLGEQAAHVLDLHLRNQVSSLMLTSATVNNNIITCNFDVPIGPLQWTTTSPTVHAQIPAWTAGKGFEVEDNNGNVTITGVQIVGNTVVITCASPPGVGKRLSYAMYQDINGQFYAGLTAGRRGLLCDSDPFVGIYQEYFNAYMTNGYNVATASDVGALRNHNAREFIFGSGLADGVYVTALTGDSATMSTVWEGPTSNFLLRLQNDHRNHLVPFSIPL